VASLSEVVGSAALSNLLDYVTRPRSEPPVETVALVEDLSELEHVKERAIVLLTHGASAQGGSYRFDVALRLARSRHVAALVLSTADVGRITPTAAAVADRSGTAILATGADTDLAQLAVAIARELAGGAESALLRAHTAVRAIEAHPPDGTAKRLLDSLGSALGVPLAMVDEEPDSGPKVAVRVDDGVAGWLTAAPQAGNLGMALDIVLHAAADEVREGIVNAQRAHELPIQSQQEVLTELLSVPPERRLELVLRARDLGLQVDGWHVAARLELEQLADGEEGALAAYQTRLRLARAALQAVRTTGGIWHGARAGTALLLLRMYPDDPGVAAAADVAKIVDRALASVRSLLPPPMLIRCGVGSAHAEVEGLLSSAAEAKAAVAAARTSGRANTAVPFDSVGLRRTLVDWYALDTAQEAVTTVLAPLLELGGARAERLIQTLHVYLDQRGSLTKTAEVLNMHRNAVSYRVNQIFSILDVDQDNPDDLLLLQLACRARELV
jgi:hypothetical protein